MPKNYYEFKEEAELWLKDKDDEGRIVFKKSELNTKIYNYLKANAFLVELQSKYFFIKRDDVSSQEAFRQFYWKILIQFLNLRFPSKTGDPAWYLTGAYPYKFLVDRVLIPRLEDQITIQTKSSSNTRLTLFGEHEIVAIQDRNFDDKTIIKKDIFNEDVFLLKPEYMIVNSNPTQYKLYEETIVAYIKNKDFDFEYLEDYFKRNKSPITHARFIGALNQVNENIKAIRFEEIFKSYDYKNVIENPFSKEYKLKRSAKPSFVTRFGISMQKAKDYLKTIELPRRLSKKINEQAIDKLTADDAYHSLTIEGYDVTKEIIHRIQSGDEFDLDLKNQSATQGFLRVLLFVKSLIKIDYEITADLTEELWRELWSPSINAGLFKYEISIYRNHFVSIKNSQSVPPGHEKIHYLLEEFYEHANDFDNGMAQAIFLHFFYVWIHPHSDGNGRVSRFLMNLALIKDKYKWLTIPANLRPQYFSSLEKSQVEDDISHFANFILKTYKDNPEL